MRRESHRIASAECPQARTGRNSGFQPQVHLLTVDHSLGHSNLDGILLAERRRNDQGRKGSAAQCCVEVDAECLPWADTAHEGL